MKHLDEEHEVLHSTISDLISGATQVSGKCIYKKISKKSIKKGLL